MYAPGSEVLINEFNPPKYVESRSGGFDSWIPGGYVPVISGNGGALAIEVATGAIFLANYDLGVEIGLEDEGTSEEIMSQYADSWDSLCESMGSWAPLPDL